MPQPQLQPEKRNIRRFSLTLPVVVRSPGNGEIRGITRDVSSRGAYVYLESNAGEGVAIEFLMTLPSEVTLTEPIHVLCSGKVVRVEQSAAKPGLAVSIEKYDFVSEK